MFILNYLNAVIILNGIFDFGPNFVKYILALFFGSHAINVNTTYQR